MLIFTAEMLERNHKIEKAHRDKQDADHTNDTEDCSSSAGELRVNNRQSMENRINSNDSGSDRINNVPPSDTSRLLISEGMGDGSHVPIANTTQQGLSDSNNCAQVAYTGSVQSTSDSAQIQNATNGVQLQSHEKVPVQETAPNTKTVSLRSTNNNGANSQQKLPQSMDLNDANNSANTVPYGIQETKPSSAVTDACSKSDDKSLNCDRSKSDINSLNSDRLLDSFLKKVPVWGISVGVLGIAIVAAVFLSRK